MTMLTQDWVYHSVIGPKEYEWRSALATILSPEFAVKLNVVSGFRAYFRAASKETSVYTLYKAIIASAEARETVLDQIRNLAYLEIDRRYENPNDTALAVLLWIILFAAPELVVSVADLVDRAPQSWYAKELARRILIPSKIKSGDSDVSVIQREFITDENLYGESLMTLKWAGEPAMSWYFAESEYDSKATKPELVEVP